MKSINKFIKQAVHTISPSVYDQMIFVKDWIRSEAGHLRRKHTEKMHRNKKETVILFLVISPAEWSSFKTVYEACKEHPLVRPYLIALGDPRLGEEDYSKCLNFLREIESETIGCKTPNGYFDLRSLSPEIVFYQAPYNLIYPKPYDMKKVSRYAKICYIPYACAVSDPVDGAKSYIIQYGRPLVEEAWAVFVSDSSEEIYLRKLNSSFAPRNDIRIINVGYPRFDLISWPNKSVREKGHTVTFGWTPRWETGNESVQETNFFRYQEDLISYFKKHPEYNLIIRPHPLMFWNFVKKGVMTQQEVDLFKAQLLETTNIRLDTSPDYQGLLHRADAMIMDFSALVVEFSLTGKPLLYCDTLERLNETTKKLLYTEYLAENWQQMQRFIEMVAQNKDANQPVRDKVIPEILGKDHGHIGKNIVDICVTM